MPKRPTAPKVGQVWRDLDIRSAVDEFTIVAVGDEHVTVRRSGYTNGRPRETRIRIDRLLAGGKRGYEYVGMKR